MDQYANKENYQLLTYEDTLTVKQELAPLMEPDQDEASALRFDALLYGIELAQLAGNPYSLARRDLKKKVTALATVANIPDIQEETELINKILHTSYLDDVGVDAARYFFCMRSLDSQLDFDMTLATEKSNENPVYYIQYAHARICSIARQLVEAGIEAVALDELKLDTLQAPEELALVKKLGEYPELLARAARERAVHHVATYTYELATLFHSFYNQCRILGVDTDLQQARIALVKAVGHTIRHALGILGVSAPERM